MHKFLIVFFLCVSQWINAQEELAPLDFFIPKNTAAVNKQGDIHNTYIYVFDTIDLPFLDDFSTDRFPDLNSTPNPINVLDSTWFRIEISGTLPAHNTVYMEDTTFRFQYDTIDGFGFDSIVEIGKIANNSINAFIYDIDNYPVTFSFETVWPGYNVYDSVWTPLDTEDTILITQVDADIIQDSSTVYFVTEDASDSLVLWQDEFVYRNFTYAKNIQTLGIVSFDGLNENGYPYDFTSPSATGAADLLTSKPINMGSFTPADSVYFSFLAEPGGYGEEPEIEDSLILQFWSPLTQDWQTQWRNTGFMGSSFSFELVPVTDPIFFIDGFQFRFISYGTLTGSLDVWHVDYVHLDALRAFDETSTEDWAFSYPSESFINNYTSMPWPHYEFNPSNAMRTEVSAQTYNSSDNTIFISPSYMEQFYEGVSQGINNYIITSPNVQGNSAFAMDYMIPTTFHFDENLADTCADFLIKYNLNTNTLNDLDLNDTLTHIQHFSNYYSYDDGSAEAGYGLVSTGAELAYRFNLPLGLEDTIRAIDIHFTPSVYDVSNELFFLQIWNDIGGEPGDVIYTTDDDNLPVTYSPEYSDVNNGFVTYELPEEIALTGTFYIGWKQSSSARLNVGFDYNTNNQANIFYNTSGFFQNTGFEGSLMMRPVFKSDKDNVVNVNENVVEEDFINLFPNPTSSVLNHSSTEAMSYYITDINGRVIRSSTLYPNEPIQVENLENGMYLFSIIASNGKVNTSKFIISK